MQSDLIAHVRVTGQQGNSADLQIEALLSGQEFQPQVRLWGDTGELCRPAISDFPLDSQWIVALQRINSVPENGFNPFKPNISYGRQGDYSLSSCGVYWLPVKGGRVSGNILSATRWQYLDPKKTPVILPLFVDWLNGKVDDQALAEAVRPQPQSRQLLNNTKMFLWQLERDKAN